MTARKLMVSIVCTNFNKGEWIREAIESFLAQKCEFDYEIILIDDASTDVSPGIIKQYAESYPERIRAFYNQKNLGITKTWIKVCKEAKGKYIARCDGDDYWTDAEKLQKQVELLEKDKGSSWCSTDYDIITPEGKLTNTSAFENKLVDRSSTYAEMLATKGFTMSSTWLVDADLMREVNEGVDSSAVDDTFNIQLDLFNKTRLTYLPEATVVYRLNDGSDSRPIEIEKIRSRNERLLKTQLEYIEKYKDVDYGEILRILLPRDMQNEMWAIERLQIIHEQRRHIQQQEVRILEQEAHIRELGNVISTITGARSYRLARICLRLARLIITLPTRAAKKLLWFVEYRRHKRYLDKNLQTGGQLEQERELSKELPYQPLISIVVPTYNTPGQFFVEMVDSVMRQTYPNWELVLVDDASPDENTRTLIQRTASNDKRITYKFLQNNHHIAGATNEGFRMAKGEFVALLDHDDVLQPNALFEIVKALNENRNLDFIYTDEDKITDKNRHIQPFVKPDWNPDFLYSVNYITHFTTIRKSLLAHIGYEDGEYNGAQDWELFLRAARNTHPDRIFHIPKVLYSWRAHEASTAKAIEAKPYVVEAQRKAIESDLKEKGLERFALRQDRLYPGQWELGFRPGASPKVSIVVPQSAAKQTAQHIENHTDYENFEIITVNPEATYEEILHEASGEYLVWIGQQLNIEDTDWLEKMLGDAARKDTGFVVGRLDSTKAVMKMVKELLDNSGAALVASLSRRSVAKHLYLTARYNVRAIHDGVVMIETDKFKQAARHRNAPFDLFEISKEVADLGYRNLYNPYIRMVK